MRCDPVTPPLTYSVTAIGNTKPGTLIGSAGHEQEEGLVGGKSKDRGIPRDEGIGKHRQRHTHTRTHTCTHAHAQGDHFNRRFNCHQQK